MIKLNETKIRVNELSSFLQRCIRIPHLRPFGATVTQLVELPPHISSDSGSHLPSAAAYVEVGRPLCANRGSLHSLVLQTNVHWQISWVL